MRSHAKAVTAPSTHRENGTFSLGVLAAMLVCAAAFLGIGAPAAGAAPEAGPGWGFKVNFGSLSGVVEQPRTPIGIGGNGYIYVTEANQNSGFTNGVTLFKPDEASGGEFLTHFGENEVLINMAVDPTTNAVYGDTQPFVSNFIKRWTSDGNPTPTYTADPSFEVPRGAAIGVDPTTSDLLVADPEAEAVRRYDTSGTLVATISTPSISPSWMQVLPDGSFYVASSSGPDLTHFSGTGTLLGTIAGVGTLHGLAYDPVRSLIVASVGDQLKAYSSAGALLAESTTQSGSGVGTVVSSTGLLYEHLGTSVNVYTPGLIPGVEVPDVSSITPFSFHLETEVDPGEEGGSAPADSAVRFEYRLVGAANWTATPNQAVSAPGTYSADVNGLRPNSEYEVRAVASNFLNSHNTGATKVSVPVSPPGTETDAATDVTETTAVLNGTINPYGLQSNYYFEYGTTTAYGSRIPAGIEAVAGGGRAPQSFLRTIAGLTPGTTYHFRLVATSSAGTAEGADRTFTTVAAGSIPTRFYEQVTPADKQGAAIIPRLGMQASADGNGLSFTKKAGDFSSPIVVRGFSVRGSNDWNAGMDLDPPMNVGTGGLLVHGALAISADFTHALETSNMALTPDAIEEGGNLYLVNLATGAYELVAASNLPGTFDTFAYSLSTGKFQAGAADFSWIVFASFKPLLPGAPEDAIYRWSEADGLEVVSVTPNGESTRALRANVNPVYKTTSADGSRIYFSAVESAEEGVFLREGGTTKPISVSHIAGDPATPKPAYLLGINEDGRYVFFYTNEGVKLTDDAPGSNGDMYRYDLEEDSLEYLGTKGFFSVNAGVLMSTGSMGISDDGSTIYFDADFGGPLMVWRDGVVHQAFPGGVESGYERMSPDGRFYVRAESARGFDEPEPLGIYDAENDELDCISCLPDGTPAPGYLPSTTAGDVLFSNQGPRAVLNDGSVYFNTAARLVAADVNGTQDVYVYKDGAASLVSPGNRSFDAFIADVSASGNDIFFTTAQKLVGRDNDESIDVYDSRVGGGLPAQNPPPSQECLRDDCKATPNAGPELPFGGSEALSGPGNVTPAKQKKCGKGKRAKKVKGKVRCVKKQKANKNKKGGNR